MSESRPLTEAERHQILVEWNTTAVDHSRDCAHRLIAAQATRTPERVAVRHDGRELTYRELDRRANQLAHHLRALGVGPEVPVGVYVAQSAEWVVAALAVWKAGGAYLSLDPGFPADRLAFYVTDSRTPVLITQGDLASRLPATGAAVVRLDADAAVITARPDTDPEVAVGPDHLAYVLYTSGSTGKPKGVMVQHGGLTNFLASMRRVPGFGDADRFLGITTPAFDIHTLEVWLPLVLGAAPEVVDRATVVDGRALAAALRRARPTVVQATPTTWRLLLAAGWEGDRTLKAITGGEALTADLADALLPCVGELWNLYGPTETTVWSTAQRITTSEGPIPIGRPIDNTQVYVLDPDRQPVPVGAEGELYIGGAGVARGYLNRPEQTAERFVQDPFTPGGRLYKTGDLARWRPDGTLDYLGRVDQQVKVRGFRIELGEIEAALAKHPGVGQAVVAARRDGSGSDSLAAYVVPRDGQVPAAEELRRFLSAALPDYMVPTHYVTLAVLPMTPNGKVDRKALPAPDAAAPVARTVRPPRTDAERDLAAIWEEVLGVKPVGAGDDFFELGGHSYAAAVMLAKVQQRLGHNLPLGTLFAAPTVEKLAAVLQRKLEADTAGSLVPLREEGARPPVFLIAGVGGHVFTFHKFARLLGPDQPAYGVKAIGVDGSAVTPDRVEAIAARYAEELAAARPVGPVVLGGYSIGAVVALELAIQLQERGRPVGPLVVFDMMAPGYPRKLPLPRRALMHLKTLARGGSGAGRWAYLRERAESVKRRALWKLGLATWVAPTIEGVDVLPQETLKRVWVALQDAQQRYWPRRPFDGRVLLFQAAEAESWAATVFDDPEMGWGRWATGGVEIHTVPGGHLEMFRDSNLAPVAATLRARLDALLPGA